MFYRGKLIVIGLFDSLLEKTLDRLDRLVCVTGLVK